MKLKYYIRGLGIGVIVTAILMGFNQPGQQEKITNDEIIRRAKELGMYESIIVSETASGNVTEQTVSESEVEDIISDNEAKENASESEVKETVSANEDSSSDNEDVSEEGIEPAEVVITINSGEGSLSVCKKLVQAGLIEDAVAYDSYLATNGYDKRIKTGNHVILIGISEEEIANIISSK